MSSPFVSGEKPGHPCSSLMKYLFAPVVDFLVYQVSPFWINLFYFALLSVLGFLSLKITKPRDGSLDDLDLFFTSVSASTVSSMSIVEMEAFSNAQLIILTVLMLMGGEVFTSMLELRFKSTEIPKNETPCTNWSIELIELGKVEQHPSITYSKQDGIRFLSYVVLGYLLVVQTVGSSLVSLYTTIVPSASKVLKRKGIQLLTFSVFTTVSTFTNCGFVPTNENMMVFKENSGLLLILIPQLLMGNTLYPVCLRTVIWALRKLTNRTEFSFVLDNYDVLGYGHLISWLRSFLLGATVVGLIMLQLLIFCFMEWRTKGFEGLNPYQRFVGSFFQVVNSRHAGESIVDLSTLSSAVLALFIVMMYLPPYTSFVPAKRRRPQINDASGDVVASSKNHDKKKMSSNCGALRKILGFSSLSQIVMFVIMICITERQNLEQDPLNFNVFNIVLEVVSAYGNVGFSMGYSCGRRRAIAVADRTAKCVDKWYGFAGWWSKEGKLILILVMFLGRLKRFSLHGGRAWILA